MGLFSFIVAFSTAMLAPGISDHIPEAEPVPILPPVALVQPASEENREEKPLPNNAPIIKEEACNCYNILKETFSSVPSMGEIVASAGPEVGNVAVFRYPPTEAWPDGIPHVALVRAVLPDGTLHIEEYNYHRCAHSFRIITPTDHRLIGFMNL